MPTIEQLRSKIDSVEDMQSVVKTMKTISAVSIRQFERAAESLAEYNRTVELGLQIALQNRPGGAVIPKPPPAERLGAVVFGSDQGLCGSFNEDVAEFMAQDLRNEEIEKRNLSMVAVGQRLIPALEALDITAENSFTLPGSSAGISPVVQDILLQIEKWRFIRQINRIKIYHNRPLPGAGYRPQELLLLPLDEQWLEGLQQRPWPTRVLPAISMDWRALFASLVRQHVFVSLYRACAESLAGEHAGRLASMQAAENNIEDKLEILQMRYRQERQRAITEELFDIVSGFEALTT